MVKRVEKPKVFQLFLLGLFLVEVPEFQSLVFDDVVEDVLSIDSVLVDFVEVFGHL